ncbi:MAG: 30S ribosome-binding factor RbfA [Ignavibacteria bacterium]|jgi:ribosome-binding factor A|nr:30S ribosome-binding factor RbfA [Ignavibacteria bacterium]MCU7515188.1 30S ribosome-binding factor RbfA [Ignavibacteria bacterium]
MAYRKDKLSQLIKEEVSWIFLYKLKDASFGLVTVTNVRMSPDLKIAKIYISVFEKQQRQAVLNRLNEAKGLIRAELAHKIQVKFIPELDFYIDDTTDYVERIEDLFKKIHKDDDKNGSNNQANG